jgi:hypothetical protein
VMFSGREGVLVTFAWWDGRITGDLYALLTPLRGVMFQH